MTELQKYFEDFHNKIKLSDENEILREKREVVLNKLKSRLKKIFEERGETAPPFVHFNKGSYAMGTGTVPINCDYDIDIGLLFDLCKDNYPDPVVVKGWVYDALEGHTDEVTIMQPCVRVQYHLEGEPVYHLDLAVYAHADDTNGQIYLARGKQYSSPERRIWEEDDPKGFIKLINNRFADENDHRQFRRVIRYLKRWKDFKFSSNGNAAPIGIGITVAAYLWFSPRRVLIDFFGNKYKDNDLNALSSFVDQMLRQFRTVDHEGEQAERLIVTLPVPPYNDLFKKMSNLQMSDFKRRLEELRGVLKEVEGKEADPDPVEACKKLQSQFGDDFLVPEVNETAQRKSLAIVSSSASA
jgi:hypothetical protein